MHTSYRVWSALIVTSWKNTPHVCCRSCGRKYQMGDLALSAVVGWWGFPWGLVMTPVQIARNLMAMFRAEELRPSEALERAMRMMIVSRSTSAK